MSFELIDGEVFLDVYANNGIEFKQKIELAIDSLRKFLRVYGNY